MTKHIREGGLMADRNGSRIGGTPPKEEIMTLNQDRTEMTGDKQGLGLVLGR